VPLGSVTVSGKFTPKATLKASASTVTYGASITLTAVISGTGVTPTGTVTFLDGATQLGVSALKPSGAATYTVSAPPAGTHSITASYSGDSNYSSLTSSAIGVTVRKASSSLTWAAPAAITYGAALTATQLDATAAVAGSYAYTPAAGTVLGAGSHTLTVAFTPASANYASATAKVKLSVAKAAPGVQLTASAAAIKRGASDTFTATLSGAGAAPSGTVSFFNGAKKLGAASLNSSGVATYATTKLPVGSDKITASYAGSSNYLGATSTAVTVTVTAP
jgi:hypothetical protein